MPTKLIKILQRESGPFTTSNNLCSIDFDPNNVTDLSASYLNMEITFTNQDGSIPDGRVHLGHLDSAAEYDTSCFIRHATLRADNVGLVEQQRFCNVNSQTMKQFEMSTEEARAERVFNSELVTVDANGTAHLICPLTKILGCANSELMYPDNRMGQTRLELEFETQPVAYKADFALQPDVAVVMDGVQGGNAGVTINELTSTQDFEDQKTALLFFALGRVYQLEYELNNVPVGPVPVTITAVDFVGGKAVITFDDADEITIPANQVMDEITLTYQSQPTQLEIPEFANTTGAQNTYETITVDDAEGGYKFVKGAPYAVGYLMETTAGLEAGDPYKYGFARLKSATPVIGVPNQWTLIFDKAVITLATATSCVQGFVFLLGEVENLTWQINKVDLVLAKPLNAMQVPKYEFQTNLVELVNLPGGVNEFRRQVELEQNVDLVTMINPISCLIGESQFHSFRNSVNSVDTITKDVIIDPDTNGSIYFDKLMQSLDMLKKVQPYNGTLQVSIVPERIMPEQAIVPNNVVEFRLQKAGIETTQASILYFFKRLTKMF